VTARRFPDGSSRADVALRRGCARGRTGATPGRSRPPSRNRPTRCLTPSAVFT